jgi:hypothetical protein
VIFLSLRTKIDQIDNRPKSHSVGGFCHPDTFNYTFLTELEERRDAIEMEIVLLKGERQQEAIERVRAFINE